MLPRHEQQVVKGKIERLAQCQHDRFLGCAQGRMQRMGTVRAVLHVLSLEPLAGSSAADVEDLGGLPVRQARILDLLPDFRGGTGLRVNA